MSGFHPASETVLGRHREFIHALREGIIRDPESHLFIRLLERRSPLLGAARWLHDVGWSNGSFDLLFTDGCGAYCAVEVKLAPDVYGTGKDRKRQRDKVRRRSRKLEDQTRNALRAAGERFPGARLTALGLVFDGAWRVHCTYGAQTAAPRA